MELTLDFLEQAFSPITQVGKDELTVPVNTGKGVVNITLRALTPEEEADVQRTSARANQDPTGKDPSEIITDAIEYIERFKVAVLSYSIVAVGETSFRDIKYVETGDTLESGVKVKIPLHQALRQVVLKWSGPVRTQLFRNFSELMITVEKKAEEAIKYEPSDLDTELEKAKARVRKLEAEIERRKKPVELSVLSNQVKAIAKTDEEPESQIPEEPPEEAPETPEEVPVSEPPAPTPVRAPVAPRPSIRPDVALPPPTPSIPHQHPQPPTPQVKASAPVEDVPGVRDSIVSGDGMDEAIDAENARLMELRRRRASGLPPVPEAVSMLDLARQQFGHRRPPHAGAAETEVVVAAERARELDPFSDIPDEVAAMGRGPEVLSRRPETPPEPPKPIKDGRNPRFNQRKMP